MTSARWLVVSVFLGALLGSGCAGGNPENMPTRTVTSEDPEAEVQSARAKLSPEDRALVEAQEFCAVSTRERLGSMGKPYKVMVRDQPVFLCCKGCEKKALANPEKTLARVAELKAKNAPKH